MTFVHSSIHFSFFILSIVLSEIGFILHLVLLSDIVFVDTGLEEPPPPPLCMAVIDIQEPYEKTYALI